MIMSMGRSRPTRKERSSLAAVWLISIGLIVQADRAALPGQVLPSYPDSGGRLVLQFPSTGNVDVIGAADFNCDGLIDIVLAKEIFASPQTFEIEIMLNNGDGSFRVGTAEVIIGPVPHVQQASQILIADFNGDSRADIFIPDLGQDAVHAPDGSSAGTFPGHQNTLLLSTPECTLVDATANLPQEAGTSNAAATADIDGTGTLDLLIVNGFGQNGIPPQIWLNDGTGHFTVGQGRLPLQVTDLGQNQYLSGLFVDVNNDGCQDIVLGGSSGYESVVLLNDCTGRFSLLPNAVPAKPFGLTAKCA
jgi:VCBS repeat protein